MLKSLLLFAVICALAVCAYGDTQPFIWSGTNNGVSPGTATNSRSGTNVNIAQHEGWSNPFPKSNWISFYPSNDTGQQGHDTGPCGLFICNGEFTTFTHTFDLSLQPSQHAVLYIMADDTADVFVNNTKIFSAATVYGQNGNTFTTCSNVPVGCLNPATVGVKDISSYLNVGSNTLRLDVYQVAGTGYGLDYAVTVPEPGFYGIAAIGMSGLWFAFRRRRNS